MCVLCADHDAVYQREGFRLAITLTIMAMSRRGCSKEVSGRPAPAPQEAGGPTEKLGSYKSWYQYTSVKDKWVLVAGSPPPPCHTWKIFPHALPSLDRTGSHVGRTPYLEVTGALEPLRVKRLLHDHDRFDVFCLKEPETGGKAFLAPKNFFALYENSS